MSPGPYVGIGLALLDDAAAADFAATYAAALSHLAESPAKEQGT